jgi:hypothetical protein
MTHNMLWDVNGLTCLGTHRNALAFVFTVPGIPVIYAGTELGMVCVGGSPLLNPASVIWLNSKDPWLWTTSLLWPESLTGHEGLMELSV